MIRFYHGPIMVNGHLLLVDVPWLTTREEYAKWFAELEEWDRNATKEMNKNDSI